MELCKIYRETLILMGVTVFLSLRRQIKKTMLWHQRLGHIGEKGLQTLHGEGMVEGMSNCTLDFDFCEHSIYGKKN